MKTVKEVTAFLKTDATKLVKTLLYKGKGGIIAALLRGDRELNEAKLARHVGPVEMADPATVEEISGAAVGFAGPVGLKGVRMIADHEVKSMTNFVSGANETDAHLINVNLHRDFTVEEFADLRFAEDGDPCPRCDNGFLELKHCIELGHIFKLGTKYSEAMGATFQDEDGQVKPIIMGCYGIGVSRIVAAVAEISHDDKGIIWPPAIAPFSVQISLLDPHVPELVSVADKLYANLQEAGLDVLYDDRDERPGVKFADADLIGIPVNLVVGKRTRESGEIELQRRCDKSRCMVSLDEVVTAVKAVLAGQP
jgi:prolyl-tRNA synthetase